MFSPFHRCQEVVGQVEVFLQASCKVGMWKCHLWILSHQKDGIRALVVSYSCCTEMSVWEVATGNWAVQEDAAGQACGPLQLGPWG